MDVRNIHKKEFIISALLFNAVLCMFLSKCFSDFYWRASDLVFISETLLFLYYISFDVHLFKKIPKAIYCGIVSLAIVNLFFSATTTKIKFQYSEYCSSRIEEIIATQHENYITEYSTPAIILVVVITVILCASKKQE